MSAAVTQGGRFVYVDDQTGQLYIESVRVHGSFSLLYGSTAYAVAIHETLGIVALLCPADTATGLSRATSDEPQHLLRLYKLVGDDVTDLVAEVTTRPGREVMWVGRRHLVVVGGGVGAGTTTVYELSRNHTLRLSAEDTGICPCRVLSYLALLDPKTPTMMLWNVERNKVVDRYFYPTRRERRSRRRPMTCIATNSVAGLVFFLYSNHNIHAAYVDKETRLRKLVPPLLTDFAAEPPPLIHEDRGDSSSAASASSQRLLVAAVSETCVLLGLQGGSLVVQYVYSRGGHTLKAVDTARLPPGECLVALSATRCLVRTRHGPGRAMGAHALSPYHTLVLNFASATVTRRNGNCTGATTADSSPREGNTSKMSVILERLLRHTMASEYMHSEADTAVVVQSGEKDTVTCSAASTHGNDKRASTAARYTAIVPLLMLGVTCGVTVAALCAWRRILRQHRTLSPTR